MPAALWLAVLFAASPSLGQTFPVLTGRVVDGANVIAARDEAALGSTLQALEQATSDQVVVVTVTSLGGQPIEQYARALGSRWGIGRADLDNGVVMLVAPSERRVRVEVGSGLSGLISDDKAGDVVAAMLPWFARNDFAGGLRVGVGKVDQMLRGDPRRPQPRLVPIPRPVPNPTPVTIEETA